MKQLGAAESCCHGNHCRCVVQGIINPRLLEFVKKNKIKKKGKEDKECNKYHKPRALQTFLKGRQNSIVTCDLSEENIAGDKGI